MGVISIELEMNRNHINDLINKNWIPYYRLKSITRDKLWGKLADYSKDLNLMKKLNHAYSEFELINNKIDILNQIRIPIKTTTSAVESTELIKEKKEQLKTSMSLGHKVISIVDECLKILNKTIEN